MSKIAIKQEQTQQLWLPLPPKAKKNEAPESAIAYKAFQTYYLMEKRSLKKVAQELGKSVKVMERWSRAFRWVERAESWDWHRSNLGKPGDSNRMEHCYEADESEQSFLPLAPKRGKYGASETALNYSTLMKYMAMPPGERSLRELAQREGKSEKLMEKWSSKFRWAERTAAWDRHQAIVFAAEHEQRERERAIVEARRRNDQNERLYQASEKLLDRADQMLSFPLTETVVEKDESGRPITILKPAKWSLGTAVDLLLVALRMADWAFASASAQYGFSYSKPATKR